MSEKVVIGDATLYCGDCLEILPALPKVDALITDPVWPNCPTGMLWGANGKQDALLRSAINLCCPIKRAVLILGFDSDPRWLAKVVPEQLPFIRSQQLPYAMPGYRGRLLGGDEIAYVFGSIPKGHGVIPGRARTETSPKSTRMTGHPCPRSDIHLESLVGWWAEPDDIIVDPFMGTCATGVACMQLGRKFIGIEIERRYFDIACERIENAQRQGQLIPTKQEPAETIPMFAEEA